jgi:hypothetical protein
MNVAAVDQHATLGRNVAAGDELEEGRLSRAVGPQDADRLRLRDVELRAQRERGLAVETRPVVPLDEAIDLNQRAGRMGERFHRGGFASGSCPSPALSGTLSPLAGRGMG